MRDGLASFLSLLVHSALCVQAGNGIFYQMSSPYLNYVGPPSSMSGYMLAKGLPLSAELTNMSLNTVVLALEAIRGLTIVGH